jgi:hypothetical protein
MPRRNRGVLEKIVVGSHQLLYPDVASSFFIDVAYTSVEQLKDEVSSYVD